MSERKPIDIEAVYAETMRRFPKTMEALRQSELAETPQPKGYSRDDAEGRIAEQLERHCRLPDAAMVTVFLGDLRKLAPRKPWSGGECWLKKPGCEGFCGRYGCEGR